MRLPKVAFVVNDGIEYDLQNSLKRIYNDISERVVCRFSVRWNALTRRKLTEIMCTIVGLMMGCNLLTYHTHLTHVTDAERHE